jgi:hypothetical protein
MNTTFISLSESISGIRLLLYTYIHTYIYKYIYIYIYIYIQYT